MENKSSWKNEHLKHLLAAHHSVISQRPERFQHSNEFVFLYQSVIYMDFQIQPNATALFWVKFILEVPAKLGLLPGK